MSDDGKQNGIHRLANNASTWKSLHGQSNFAIEPKDHGACAEIQLSSSQRHLHSASTSLLQSTVKTGIGKSQTATAVSIAANMTSSPTQSIKHSTVSTSLLTQAKDAPRTEEESSLRSIVRPLGGIERLYYHSNKQGQDIISLMDKVHSVYPIEENIVRQALQLLLLRHPLLRMSIQSTNESSHNKLNFIRRDDMICDFYASDRKDWLNLIHEEIQVPFDDGSKPLWRCRMLNSSYIPEMREKSFVQPESCTEASSDLENKPNDKWSNNDMNARNMLAEGPQQFMYTTTFVFILHHSIMDGRYSLWIFHDLMKFIDAIMLQSAITDSCIEELPLLPPMEECFLKLSEINQISNSASSGSFLKFGKKEGTHAVLQDYNIKYHNEILNESKQKPRNSFLTFRCSKNRSMQFLNHCKATDVSVNGAFVTASIFALIDLIYPNGCKEPNFEIPFEYMLDMRRYYDKDVCDNVPTYPGVMSYHVPMKAYITSKGQSARDRNFFWKTAKQFGDSMQCDIDSPGILRWVHKEAHPEDHGQTIEKKGKSPFVLCLSNMGRLDHVIQGDLAKRIRLVDTHGHSSILINDMPLFFVSAYTLNGHFCGNISYCAGYTSSKTASEYMGHLLRYVHDHPSL